MTLVYLQNIFPSKFITLIFLKKRIFPLTTILIVIFPYLKTDGYFYRAHYFTCKFFTIVHIHILGCIRNF